MPLERHGPRACLVAACGCLLALLLVPAPSTASSPEDPILEAGEESVVSGNDPESRGEPAVAPGESEPGEAEELDLIDLVFHPKDRSPGPEVRPGKPHFVFLPVLAYTPATSAAFGASGNVAWLAGEPSTTHISAALAYAAFTLKQQVLTFAKSFVYTADDRFGFRGDWRFLWTNQGTWGLGPLQPDAREDDLDFKFLRFYETGYVKIARSFFVGVGFHCDYHFDIQDVDSARGEPSPVQQYYDGTNVTRMLSMGMSIDLLYDTRNNQINPTSGVYGNASISLLPTGFGSDATWESLWLEFRAFPRLGWRNTLALWTWVWLTFGKVPYLDLPAIGWDTFARSGRGYTQGRIRAPDLMYAEVEYRIRFMRNDLIGMVVFANLTAASDPSTGEFRAVNPALGTGLRVKLNRKSETNLAIDFAVGESGSMGVYMNLQEAF